MHRTDDTSTFPDDKTPVPDGDEPEPSDLISTAHQKCLAASCIVEALLARMQEDPPDRRTMALASTQRRRA